MSLPRSKSMSTSSKAISRQKISKTFLTSSNCLFSIGDSHKAKKKTSSIKIRLHKDYSSIPKRRNDYEISSQKKIESQIKAMNKENRSEFREALNKHNFDTEVFIPR